MNDLPHPPTFWPNPSLAPLGSVPVSLDGKLRVTMPIQLPKTTVTYPCVTCGGTGIATLHDELVIFGIKMKSTKQDWCVRCGGKGKVTEETIASPSLMQTSVPPRPGTVNT